MPYKEKTMKKEYDGIRYLLNSEMLRKRTSDWYYTNRDKVLAKRRERKIWSLYRDKKMGAPARPDSTNCKLCGKPITGRNICGDHNHFTGKFRGWLCRPCNRSLGWYERKKEKIMEYLK